MVAEEDDEVIVRRAAGSARSLYSSLAVEKVCMNGPREQEKINKMKKPLWPGSVPPRSQSG